ncbi:MAG: 30S ribosomal protein S9 [Candidatus Magasanikbacteria bacterium]|nr:30S ribosomal protein S9 [Candidatus Magasanikbacteria bacterium]
MTKISTTIAARAQTVGRRKSAAARVRLAAGRGAITINGLALAQYFPYFAWQDAVVAPFKALGKEKEYDTAVKVAGGGKPGQAMAVQLGIARALLKENEEWRKSLKTGGFLTRDPRVKERKKPGLKRARRAPQWSKR